jgi:ABC-2 type transport system permease protein
VVTSQVTEHARAASGLALALLGIAFLLRAIGDVQTEHGSWVSWLSPIGWAQQIRAFVDLRWWPLGLSLALVVLLLVLGAALAAKRDLGAGLVPPRAGRPDAAAWLAGPLALAWRQQRASVLAWGVGVGVTALACGTFVDSVGDMVAENPDVAAMLGDPTDLTSGFVAIMALFLGLGACGFAVASAQRARGEETAGRLEPLLATGLGRLRWYGGQLVVTLLGTAVLLAASALGLWLGALSVGEDTFGLVDYLSASFAYLPAIAVVTGVAVAAFGWRPGLAVLAWALLAYSFVVTMFGALLDLPDTARAVSPFWHVPQLPGTEVEPWPFVWLTVIAVALVTAGLAGFRKRDVPRP